MAIKTAPILTREDYNEAQVTLGLTYAEVGKETGIPRQYLSEFRSGTRNLLPEHQRKLRSYFEDRGIVFEDYEDTPEPTNAVPANPARTTASLMPEDVRSTSITCLHFAIGEDIQPHALRKIVGQMIANEARLEELLGKKAETGILSEWSGETEADVQEAKDLMAQNFVLFSLAQGKGFVYRDTPENDDAKNVRDVLNDTFANAFTGDIGRLVNARPASKTGQPEKPAAMREKEEQAWV